MATSAGVVFFGCAFVLACGIDGSGLAAPAMGSGTLVIATDASVSASVINTGGSGLDVTVRNAGSRVVYTKAGDGFDPADEQDPFYVSAGSDAVVEGRGGSGVWTELDMGVAIEGTKYIALKPGKTYRLIGTISAPAFRGQARVRVRYSSSADRNGQQAVDYSNVFEVR
ncbi:MAG: hypothetical protein MNPFHGCM_02675 [Gemmatimonadaceae bacterium]|nr:hypothetical protein [Gemmatimonadaceae bacterium]